MKCLSQIPENIFPQKFLFIQYSSLFWTTACYDHLKFVPLPSPLPNENDQVLTTLNNSSKQQKAVMLNSMGQNCLTSHVEFHGHSVPVPPTLSLRPHANYGIYHS